MADVSSASAALGSYLGRGARRKAEADCPLASALQYFKQVEAGTPCRGNYVLENHLEIVERVAFTRGLPPEGIAAMLDLALSLRIANNTFGLRVLKCLIPASVVPDNAVTRGVSWFCVGKLSSTMQTMFIRWLITVFDLIEPKEQLHALYGIFFSFLPDENLKWNTHLVVPPVSSCVPQTSAAGCVTGSNSFPLEQLATFPQLLQNIHCIELPAQMGSVLNSPLVLHYVNCVTDDSVFLRLDYWLGHALHEEFLFCKDTNYQNHSEATEFFNTLITAQQFLQEGFSSTEVFIYKFLRVWDGSLFRSQILTLLSSIPMIPCSDMKHLLFEPLMQLFFTSSLFFKCSVVECLNNMLVKWLTWHSVYATEDQIDLSVSGHSPMNMSLSGLMSSVVELVQFVGRLSTVALHLEAYNTLLLHFILDFYETVCDMYLKYDLPLVVMPPAGVFYPALLSKEPVSLNQLCHIMFRYRANLVAAKHPDVQTTAFHISRRTYREYNQYVVAMVSCLWKSNAFLSGMGIEVSQDLLAQTELSECRTSFNIVHHPALMGCAIDFFHKVRG
ncbi:CENPI protein, partial [Amia calva]|nr:CENPI protein [Amia calva]